MKINLIGEIGLNHLGNKKYLEEYRNILSKNKIDGISIQIPQKSLMDSGQKKFLLTDSKITEFVKFAKKKFKLVGITTSDKSKINFFNKLNIDFFKVTSGMISNIHLIKKMQKSKIKKIYLSTGFSNYAEIDKILKKVKKNKISLIHTSFKNNEINLRRILILKKKFNLPVAYGNHSIVLETLSNAVFYEPEALFFYVKLNKRIKYPDHNHAIKLSELKNVSVRYGDMLGILSAFCWAFHIIYIRKTITFFNFPITIAMSQCFVAFLFTILPILSNSFWLPDLTNLEIKFRGLNIGFDI